MLRDFFCLSLFDAQFVHKLGYVFVKYVCDIMFEKHNIEYDLKNETTGHFHCHRKSDDKLFQFYAGTGKIMGYDRKRGYGY